MMKSLRGRKIFFVITLVVLVTTPLYANAGTWILVPALLHVIVLNVLIGVVESIFVRTVWKVQVNYGFVILGNYVSSIPGIILAFPFSTVSPWGLTAAMVILFSVTVPIEWPFFAMAVKERFFSFSKASFKYTLGAQCVSYVLLIPIYVLLYDGGSLPPRQLVTYEVESIFSSAYQYRLRPISEGGGDGAYTGYVTPPYLSRTDLGIYSAVVLHPDTVEVFGKWIDDTASTVSVKVGPDGRAIESSWKYKGEFLE